MANKLIYFAIFVGTCFLFASCGRHRTVADSTASAKGVVADEAKSQDTLLMKLFDDGIIDKDSLCAILYFEGRISREAYVKYSLKYRIQTMHEGQETLAVLANQMKYPFLFDHFIGSTDTNFYCNLVLSPHSARHAYSKDPRILEEFDLEANYKLYTLKDLDSAKERLLVAESESGGLMRLILFDEATNPPSATDSLELPREGMYEFRSLKQGELVRIEYPTWGTGYMAKHILLIAIVGNRIRTFLDNYLSLSATPPWVGVPTEAVGKVTLLDLNQDGYEDILEEVTTKTYPSGTDIGDGPPTVSSSVTKYIWRSELLQFEQQEFKQL